MSLTLAAAQKLIAQNGSPLYVYNETILSERANQLRAFELPYGFTPRYAVKANPHPRIITLFEQAGLEFDVSSSYEAQVLLDQGVAGSKISLSGQQPAHNLAQLLNGGVQYVATSLHQLELFINEPGHPGQVALRINPGVGSGHNRRNTTAGTGASFGLWHEYIP